MHTTTTLVRRYRHLVVALVAVAVVAVGLASPASAATGTLSGTVSDSSAAPIGGVSVDVFEATWGIPAGSTTTAADGTYSLAVTPGTYRVRFTHPTHAETWSGNTANWVTSATVTIDDGGTTIEDATMADLDTIEGTVTDPDHNPVAGLTVELLYQGLAYRTTPTATDGTYQFTDVPNATFTLGFRDPTGTTWAMQYSGGSNTAAGATPITTTGGTTHTINHTAHHGGSIKGTNGIGATGPGVAGLYVAAIDTTQFEPLAITTTGTNGTWQIDNLPPGDVTIATIDPAALGATPHTSYRIVFRPERDIDTLGLGTAWTTATRYPITTGTTTPTGRQPLRGHHCNPTTHHPGANLANANLTNQNLRGCDLRQADLSNTTFANTRLDWARLNDADLSTNATRLLYVPTGEPSPVGAYLEGADLTGTAIAGRNFAGKNPGNAAGHITVQQLLATDHDWTRVSLLDFDLRNTDFAAGNYTFDNSGSFWPDVAPVTGVLPTFQRVDLRGSSFAGMTMPWVRFGPGTILGDVDLTNTTIVRGSFERWGWGGAVLVGQLIAHANLPQLWTTKAQILSTDPDWSHVDLSQPRQAQNVEGESRLDLSGVDWPARGATLVGAKLSGINLSGGSFAGMDLTGVVCTGCTFASANLTNTNLTGVTGNPSGGWTAVYANTTCPDGTKAPSATGQTTCVGHGMRA